MGKVEIFQTPGYLLSLFIYNYGSHKPYKVHLPYVNLFKNAQKASFLRSFLNLNCHFSSSG